MDQINIGVLGCANIADRSMIPSILNLPKQFRLKAVASRSMEKAITFASKYNCEALGSYDAIIERKDIDALYIPLPTGLHDEWINKALIAGKHVYAEKSIALSLSRAKTMVDNAIEHQVALMEGFMFQYHSQHKHLKELIDEGVIGDIRFFSSSFGFPPLLPDNFRYDKLIGGGALYDAAAYPLRAAFFILGDCLNLTASSLFFDKTKDVNTFGSAFLKDDRGIGAAISFGFDNFYQCNYQIWGSKGKITVMKAFTPKPDEIPLFELETANIEEVIPSFADNHFEKSLLEFHDIVIDKNKREKHFKEILQQSEALEKIERLSL